LTYVAQHPDRLLERDELIQAVWRDVIVTDDSLVQCISELRSALGDHRQQVIRTVPRRGYMLELRPVTPAAPREAAAIDSGSMAGGTCMAWEHLERKLAAILAADIAGYSRLSGADEEGTMPRLSALRTELIDPAIQVNRGRIVKTTGDGILIEFASVVDAVRCSLEVQRGMAVRNADFIPENRIEFRIGIHLGDVMVQPDGDLLGDSVNIAVRLEGIAELGGICLSDDAYRQVRDRLKEEFTDLGDKELKNIARPVRVYSVKTSSEVSPPVPHADAPRKSGPPRLSIVVLPFVNLGGDPEQEYFVDGVTESLTTDLSRIPGAFVTAHNSALAYKGKPVDTRQIGRELGVRYVMEGSIQSVGSRIRVNAQLIDAATGAHLWAERFDKLRADLFD
ncbi:winged helix-turn-helix domain-containing protein, partial [Paraburkholderia caledonica]|uniref:winged helix-turn-helix domain-containing protein n=1 Tax=Paraburkholderia caledonica TaxID=134536 RepID=UPI0015C5965B